MERLEAGVPMRLLLSQVVAWGWHFAPFMATTIASAASRSRLIGLVLLAGCAGDPFDGGAEIGEESGAIAVCGSSIQAAIDEAPSGAVLNICAGVYEERLVINGKALTLRGPDGAAATIIDADSSGRALDINSAPGAGVTVRTRLSRPTQVSRASG